MTNIEWADVTWNPVIGCSIISEGCKNCYAMKMAHRLEKMDNRHYDGLTEKVNDKVVWTGKIKENFSQWNRPGQWKKHKRIFVNSMGDVFHEFMPNDLTENLWKAMSCYQQHTFLLLTKRADKMKEAIQSDRVPRLRNVWLGVSIENRKTLDRLTCLKETPAVVRFVSFEPLLEDVGQVDFKGIDWVIVGGESGPGARPIQPDWVRALRDQCIEQNVAFFFKQWGGTRKHKTGRLLDGRVWDEFPLNSCNVA